MNREILLWGNGDYLHNTIDKINPNLNIIGVIDNNSSKHGKNIIYAGREIPCFGWSEEIAADVEKIIVSTRDISMVTVVKKAIESADKEIVHLSEEIKKYRETWENEQIQKYDIHQWETLGDYSDDICCFVSVTVPISYCNIQCRYCYVGQHQDFYKKKSELYSPEFLKRAFSAKRFGGRLLINFCGTGETLLCNELLSIIHVLLEEGHFVSIITNALIDKSIERLLEEKHSDRIFFKCSLHYEELRKKGLLGKFSENVNKIIGSRASCSIELVPHDELIPFIDEIKEYCLKEFGAYPHVTVGRNESINGYPILTNMDPESYTEIWNTFGSSLFEVKMRHQSPEREYCIAGRGTILVDLEHGGCRCCPNNKEIANIYRDITQSIKFEEIGYECTNSYCMNSHAYLTLGMIPSLNEISYAEVRDRKCSNGNNWLKEPIRSVFQQKICNNLGC